MALANRGSLIQGATQTLAANGAAAKRAVLMYSGVLAVAELAVAVISILIENWISQATQGLSGLAALDTVAAMETVQTVLELGMMFLPTFWFLGYVYILQRMTLGEPLQDGMHLQGLRNFGPVCRKMILEGLLQFGVLMLGITVGSTLVSFTPLAEPMLEVMAQYSDVTELTEQQALELMNASAPVLVICMVIGLALLLPLMYRLRMSDYILMEHPKLGAIFSLTMSYRITRGSAFRLFLLEMSFLWYYIPMCLAAMLTTFVTFLPQLGIQLPMDGQVLYLITLAISLLIQVGIQYLASNKVEMTFVQAYRNLMEKAELPSLRKPDSQMQ